MTNRRFMAKVTRWAMPNLPAAAGLAFAIAFSPFTLYPARAGGYAGLLALAEVRYPARAVGHTGLVTPGQGSCGDPRYSLNRYSAGAVGHMSLPAPGQGSCRDPRYSSTHSSTHAPMHLLTLAPYNPPNRGAPGRTRDAGSRSCGLVALVPTQTHWGETLEAHPTLWFYLASPTETMTFELRDETTGEILSKAEFAATNGPGIGSYRLPATAPDLEPDRIYRWQLTLDCAHTDSDPTVNSIVVRREADPDLAAQLPIASPEARVDLLATHGLWYDTLTELAQLRINNPQNPDLASAWVDLLEQPVVALDDLVEMPLIPCCSSEIP